MLLGTPEAFLSPALTYHSEGPFHGELLENLGKKLETWLPTHLIPVFRTQGWQVDFYEFKGSQNLYGEFKVYMVISRTARAV